jgi:hypothetical protein
MTPLEIHNRDAGKIVTSIVQPTLKAGGDNVDILVLLETVIAGVLLFAIKPDADFEVADKAVLDRLHKSVAKRLKNLREKL